MNAFEGPEFVPAFAGVDITGGAAADVVTRAVVGPENLPGGGVVVVIENCGGVASMAVILLDAEAFKARAIGVEITDMETVTVFDAGELVQDSAGLAADGVVAGQHVVVSIEIDVDDAHLVESRERRARHHRPVGDGHRAEHVGVDPVIHPVEEAVGRLDGVVVLPEILHRLLIARRRASGAGSAQR